MYPLKALNMIDASSELELVSPTIVAEALPRADYELVNPNTGEVYRWCCNGHPCVIYTGHKLGEGTLLRTVEHR